MRRTILTAILTLSAATAALAQPGGRGPAGRGPEGQGGPPRHGPPPSTAEFLLGHAGALELTDAQVTRLAAIARRTHQQHEAMRTRELPDPQPGQQGGRPAPPSPAEMERHREQAQAERRDAIAVLTADQQAKAWEFLQRGPGGRGPGRGGPGAPGGPGGERRPGGDR